MRLRANLPFTTNRNKTSHLLNPGSMCSNGDPMDIDPILSDDSSFYGKWFLHRSDENEKKRLSQQAASFDPEPYWSGIHSNLLSTLQNELSAPSKSSNPEEEPQSATDQQDTKTPPDQRGRKEHISHFLSRLSPSKTLLSDIGPWIWMFGPTSKAQLDQDVPSFLRKGTDLLRAFEAQSAELRAEHDKSSAKTTAGLTRKLNPLRRSLEQDILHAARETGVVYGKWMLFPSARDVDNVWKKVVVALDKGELGDGAKVATNDLTDKARLICIYTKDFGDKEDVKRVLKGMVAMGLVDVEDRPIYYKCDAFTYLDITSKNEYGLKASMFSSRDVLSGKV
ncbi:unnamed protein product [Penicillium manginii]